MDGKSGWFALGTILSDRALEIGERLQISLINRGSGTVIEVIEYSPPADRLGHFDWPKYLSDHVNASATHLRAGIKQADGTFKTEYSQYLNQLWTDSGVDRALISSACDLAGWSDMSIFNAAGSLPLGTVITCELTSTNEHCVYETFSVPVPDAQTGRFIWPAFVSQLVNRSAALLRAGEKDEPGKRFVPIGSSYRNHLWAPAGTPLRADWRVTLSESARVTANTVFESLCIQASVTPPVQQVIDEWLAGFADGKFPDVIYPPDGQVVEDVSGLTEHLDRIVKIASYLLKLPASAPVLYVNKALEALDFYAVQNYDIASWWSRQIGLAKKAARAALLLAVHLKGGELLRLYIPYAMKTTTTYAHTQTGANLADFASIQILWSASAWSNSGDDKYTLYLRAAADVLSELCLPVERSGTEHGEGISVDYSISQHNPKYGAVYCTQLYSGSYGAELVGRIIESLAVLINEFSLSPAARIELVKLVAGGMGWMGYANHLDFQVNGRAISRGIAFSTHFGAWATALLPSADEDNKPVLEELIRRSDGDEAHNTYYQGARFFWVNDYMSYMGAGFCLWAKVISKRTVGGESGNGENPKGYYMGAGTYFLTRHGEEYAGIQPVWDWQRLPGTTVEQNPDFKWPNTTWGTNMWGSHDFAGGVSDGARGLLSMELSRGNVTHAYKTVMTFDNRIVCIGTKIECSNAVHPVVTSVNQCIANGTVRYRTVNGDEHEVRLGESVTGSDIDQIHHDVFLYRLGMIWRRPSVTIKVERRSGAWKDINVNGSPDVVTQPVFSVWINHDLDASGSYFYEIRPAEDFLDETTLLTAHQSTADFHYWVDEDVVMASCFDPRPLRLDCSEGTPTFYPEQPCSYIYKREDRTVQLTCSDPTQKKDKLSFTVRTDDEGNAVSSRSFPLPQGDELGRPVTVEYPLDE
ncbi:silent information regulator protein Sir2 [Pseudomonas sp. CDFA 602]|uniref:polysaccharide lyase family 8 super-sandwich domain-containing protein n=1 Tax=Pseudomonas californiensis TaxID=2829823 RepID=UPI001E608C4C|nr:polysaccharide lyase family 8 super-sandwich domain-containing protein [Pseudomonas californiensis]MCD5992501.1 silent information regulator protein Sir2 [Pseudomonas californiensis]MCD5998221.1 silent information regulator protein Sir2 [Pseudomonas californiensis]